MKEIFVIPNYMHSKYFLQIIDAFNIVLDEIECRVLHLVTTTCLLDYFFVCYNEPNAFCLLRIYC